MKPATASPTQEALAGFVERVTFHNEENGFCVLRTKARGHRDLVTVVGHSATIAAGEWITATGEWVNDRNHGQQFKARFLRTSAPTSTEGIEKYLSSGMIRGIGPVYARKLVRAFAEKVFDVIEGEPDRLREVDGIGPVRAQRIVTAWAGSEASDLTASFDGRAVTYGFGELDMLVPAYAVTIHKSQGSEYPAVVIPIMTQHYAMLQRNLIYTGITRGKKLVVLVGQKMGVAIAVRNVSGRRRWSKLAEWLAPASRGR